MKDYHMVGDKYSSHGNIFCRIYELNPIPMKIGYCSTTMFYAYILDRYYSLIGIFCSTSIGISELPKYIIISLLVGTSM